jgi:hypothetical protein
LSQCATAFLDTPQCSSISLTATIKIKYFLRLIKTKNYYSPRVHATRCPVNSKMFEPTLPDE